MRVPSTVLSALLHHSGEFSQDEQPGVVEVPAVALPILEVPAALSPHVTGGAAAILENSFYFATVLTVNVGGNNIVTVATLRPGLWKLYMFVSVIADAFVANTGASVALLQPPVGGNAINLVRLQSTNNGPSFIDLSRIISLEREAALIIQLDAFATRHDANFCILANRLL